MCNFFFECRFSIHSSFVTNFDFRECHRLLNMARTLVLIIVETIMQLCFWIQALIKALVALAFYRLLVSIISFALYIDIVHPCAGISYSHIFCKQCFSGSLWILLYPQFCAINIHFTRTIMDLFFHQFYVLSRIYNLWIFVTAEPIITLSYRDFITWIQSIV